jgi:hypothetical protein
MQADRSTVDISDSTWVFSCFGFRLFYVPKSPNSDIEAFFRTISDEFPAFLATNVVHDSDNVLRCGLLLPAAGIVIRITENN